MPRKWRFGSGVAEWLLPWCPQDADTLSSTRLVAPRAQPQQECCALLQMLAGRCAR